MQLLGWTLWSLLVAGVDQLDDVAGVAQLDDVAGVDRIDEVAGVDRIDDEAHAQFASADFSVGALAEGPRYAVRCERLLTMASDDDIHRPGLLLIAGGRIQYAGDAVNTLPEGYEVLDLGDVWAAPGMIDLHSHVHTGGWGDINDMVLPVNPELRSTPTIRPSNPYIRRACAGGITTLFGIPGSGTSMSGFGILYKTKTDATYDEAVLRDPGGLKVAQTHNPERRAGDLGLTRAGLYWLLQDINDRALEVEASGEFDPQLENLQRVLNGELPILIHCAGAIGVSSVVRMWHDEYETNCTISHGSFNGWKIASWVAEKGVPVNHGPRTMDFRSSREGRIIGTGAEFANAGVPNFSLNTDANVIPQESLSLQAAMSARLGGNSYEMLQAVTIHPARSFAIDHRVGSLEVGKDADVVLWSGDPIDPRSRVELVLIDGRIEYDRRADGQWY